MNYISGYLSSIPLSEYKNMIQFIRELASTKLNMPIEELNAILNDTPNIGVKVSNAFLIPDKEKPSNTYNRFYRNVYIDLVYLYSVINKLYDALNAFSELSASYITDVSSEISKLVQSINEIEQRGAVTQRMHVVTESFKNDSLLEKYNEDTKYLFQDRDGTLLSRVAFEHDNTRNAITIETTSIKDLVHDVKDDTDIQTYNNGKTIAKIKVNQFVGMPDDTYNITTNAIDNSETSYWECTTRPVEKLQIEYEGNEAGPAYMDFQIVLPKISKISEISLTPFCIYPVTIVQIYVGDMQILTEPISSRGTMKLYTQEVISDTIRFIIRQENFVFTTKNTNIKIEENNRLWNRRLNKTMESYSTLPVKENLFEQAQETWLVDIENWIENYIRAKERSEQ